MHEIKWRHWCHPVFLSFLRDPYRLILSTSIRWHPGFCESRLEKVVYTGRDDVDKMILSIFLTTDSPDLVMLRSCCCDPDTLPTRNCERWIRCRRSLHYKARCSWTCGLLVQQIQPDYDLLVLERQNSIKLPHMIWPIH